MSSTSGPTRRSPGRAWTKELDTLRKAIREPVRVSLDKRFQSNEKLRTRVARDLTSWLERHGDGTAAAPDPSSPSCHDALAQLVADCLCVGATYVDRTRQLVSQVCLRPGPRAKRKHLRPLYLNVPLGTGTYGYVDREMRRQRGLRYMVVPDGEQDLRGVVAIEDRQLGHRNVVLYPVRVPIHSSDRDGGPPFELLIEVFLPVPGVLTKNEAKAILTHIDVCGRSIALAWEGHRLDNFAAPIQAPGAWGTAVANDAGRDLQIVCEAVCSRDVEAPEARPLTFAFPWAAVVDCRPHDVTPHVETVVNASAFLHTRVMAETDARIRSRAAADRSVVSVDPAVRSGTMSDMVDFILPVRIRHRERRWRVVAHFCFHLLPALDAARQARLIEAAVSDRSLVAALDMLGQELTRFRALTRTPRHIKPARDLETMLAQTALLSCFRKQARVAHPACPYVAAASAFEFHDEAARDRLACAFRDAAPHLARFSIEIARTLGTPTHDSKSQGPDRLPDSPIVLGGSFESVERFPVLKDDSGRSNVAYVDLRDLHRALSLLHQLLPGLSRGTPDSRALRFTIGNRGMRCAWNPDRTFHLRLAPPRRGRLLHVFNIDFDAARTTARVSGYRAPDDQVEWCFADAVAIPRCWQPATSAERAERLPFANEETRNRIRTALQDRWSPCEPVADGAQVATHTIALDLPRSMRPEVFSPAAEVVYPACDSPEPMPTGAVDTILRHVAPATASHAREVRGLVTVLAAALPSHLLFVDHLTAVPLIILGHIHGWLLFGTYSLSEGPHTPTRSMSWASRFAAVWVEGVAARYSALAARAVFYDDLFRRDFEHYGRQPLTTVKRALERLSRGETPKGAEIAEALSVVHDLQRFYGDFETAVKDWSDPPDGRLLLSTIAERAIKRALAAGRMRYSGVGRPIEEAVSRLVQQGLQVRVIENREGPLTLITMLLTDLLTNALRHSVPATDVSIEFDNESRCLRIADISRNQADEATTSFVNTALVVDQQVSSIPPQAKGICTVVGAAIRLRLGLCLRITPGADGCWRWETTVYFGPRFLE
ncbi:MAG: hypothetical protein K8T90_19285 [Planctomycetes bacterium]|nr:hypothetical protein [Planctomycetota bacterium]